MNQATATASRPRLTRRLVVCGIALVAITTAALLYRFNPVEHAFYPRCMFHVVTGLDCPGCGGLRAAHQLLHGNIRAAFQLNPLAVMLLPVMLVGGLYWLIARRSPASAVLRKPGVLGMFAVVVIAFGLLRNLPWRTWLD